MAFEVNHLPALRVTLCGVAHSTSAIDRNIPVTDSPHCNKDSRPVMCGGGDTVEAGVVKGSDLISREERYESYCVFPQIPIYLGTAKESGNPFWAEHMLRMSIERTGVLCLRH